ncbi:tail fiber domain-containing protein [Flavobacterium quisquiliarum]|uniref:Tail fiber domain-containing protein n=1 Tax=Flavobacterium quisquiliarum TaxID=1834436 RepID=A0ABV8W679_9FLAO|nr:tail fiber domain-containing protein [Flavobacterium quisquiliarum]MBW1655407.1 hypothetical protein [Flavobacterium quisquiliarum]
MNKYLIILLSLLFPCVLLAQNRGIRAVDNKGTIIYVDPSKWFQVGTNLFNKNTIGNVAIGLDPESPTPVDVDSRLYISNGGSTTLPALKLNIPFDGELTDDLLTWDPSDFSVRKIDITKLLPNDWHLLGNAGTDPTTNFLGTTDNQDLSFRTYNTERMRIASSGNIGIGTAAPATTLEIKSATADTSGLRLTNLTSASPADLTGKTIGVNAAGDVVIVNSSVAATTVSNTSTGNSLTTTVNDVTGTAVNIINSNTLIATDGKLVSTVNGVETTPEVPVLISANNGLTATNGNVQLDGALIKPTTITTDATNTLAVEGLQSASPTGTDNIVVANPSTGVLSTLDRSFFNNDWHLLGNAETTPGTNFIGTTDDQPLIFKINNQQSGALTSVFSGANTSFGHYSLQNPNVAGGGTNNSAFGAGALLLTTTGTANTGIGVTTLQNNTSGGNNTAVGMNSMSNSATGNDNTAMGAMALFGSNAGSGNTAVGFSAGYNVQGNYNTLIGLKSGLSITSGTNNTVIGGSSTGDISVSAANASHELNIGNALYGTGINNAAGANTGKIGINVQNPDVELDVNGKVKIRNLPTVTGTDNLVTTDATGNLHQRTVADAVGTIGWLVKGNTGTNPAISVTGTDFLGTTDDQPLMFKVKGTNSGMISTDTKGKGNTTLGFKSLFNWTTTSAGQQGLNNTAIGNNTLAAGGAFSDNTAIGYNALLRSASNANTAVGSQVMATYTTSVAAAGWNTAVGYLAMMGQTPSSVSTGAYNNAFGSSALHDNSSGTGNVAIGFGSLSSNSTGSYNVAIGHNAGSTTIAGTGTGSNNILIGGVGGTTPFTINPSSVSASNEMNIGNTLFGTSINGAIGTGKIGIDVQGPLVAELQVLGSVRTGTSTTGTIGQYSFAGGTSSVASAAGSFAYGSGATATGSNSAAFGSSTASGNQSFAAGNSNKALANYSTAIGQSNFIGDGVTLSPTPLNGAPNTFIESTGNPATASFAAGYNNRISIRQAAAFGASNVVNGESSVAIGVQNTTNGQASVAMGSTNIPSAQYSVAMGFNNTLDANSTYSVAAGNGNKLIYAKQAFTAGAANEIGSSNTNTADYSAVFGTGNKIGATALSTAAFAAGSGNIINGTYLNAMGQGNNIAGTGNTAIGQSNAVQQYVGSSVALGYQNTLLSGTSGTANTYNVAAGFNNQVAGYASIALGENNIIGIVGSNVKSAVAIGYYTNVASGHDGSFVFGDRSNVATVSSTAANQFTGMFNGGYRFLTNRGDLNKGMVMDNLGNATFSGMITPSAVVLPSDIRLKKDIQTLTSVLDNIKQVRGVTYYWKDVSKGTDLQLGMIAQELEKVYPELVITNKETGLKAVNYAQFTGVLVEGIKEQQTQIEDLKSEVETLKKQMQEIKDLLKK